MIMSKKIKVAFLLGSLNRGGTETLILDVFNKASVSPFDIIGIYRKDGELSNNFNASNVRLFKLSPGSVLNTLRYLKRLRVLLKQEKTDIVHAHQRIDTIYVWLASYGLSIKKVQTFHGFDFKTSSIFKTLIRMSLKMADINLFVSKAQQNYYTSKYKLTNRTATEVVYNGINFEKLDFKATHPIREELKIENTSLLLGMIGNFNSVRDQMTVCRFLKLLNEKSIDFKFLFIGKQDASNPKLYDECYHFCQDVGLKEKALFLGSRSDVPSILPQLDAFIYATNRDTFGIAVIEAIASAIPVFINDWEVMNEITQDGKYAILYKTRDEVDLLNKVLCFLDDRELHIKNARDNAKWVKSTYSIESHINRLYEVYQQII